MKNKRPLMTTAAVLALAMGCIPDGTPRPWDPGAFPPVPHEPTEAELERIRKAQEKRARRAEKRARK